MNIKEITDKFGDIVGIEDWCEGCKIECYGYYNCPKHKVENDTLGCIDFGNPDGMNGSCHYCKEDNYELFNECLRKSKSLNKTIMCKKNWYFNKELGFKAGYRYKILDIHPANFANGLLIQSDLMNFKGWFWSGSDYFDVDSLF